MQYARVVCRDAPLVPKILAGVVTGLVPRDLGGDGRLQLRDLDPRSGAELDRRQWSRIRTLVLRSLQDQLHRLPEDILNHELPSPTVVLRTMTIGERTRRSLASVFPRPPGDEPWNIRRYLEVHKLKASGLVDLLVSIELTETAAAPHDPKLPDIRRLFAPSGKRHGPSAQREARTLATKAVLSKLARHLPLTENAAETVLASLGNLGDRLISLPTLLAQAELNGLVVPFRKVRHGGASMLVAPSDASGISACYNAAVRSMQSWGLASVRQIVRHVRVLHQHAIDSRIATAVLSSLPRFSWLDERAGWFWFKDQPNRLVRALGKVLSVARRIKVDDLLKAILRSYGFRQRPGRRVIESACSQLPGYRVDGNWVTIEPSLDRDEWLSPTELSLIEMLEETAGVASLASLPRAAQDRGISLATLRLAIRRSPIVTRTRSEVAVIGSTILPA